MVLVRSYLRKGDARTIDYNMCEKWLDSQPVHARLYPDWTHTQEWVVNCALGVSEVPRAGSMRHTNKITRNFRYTLLFFVPITHHQRRQEPSRYTSWGIHIPTIVKIIGFDSLKVVRSPLVLLPIFSQRYATSSDPSNDGTRTETRRERILQSTTWTSRS